MRFRLHPEAEAELQAAAQYYEDRTSGLGERLLVEAIEALVDIEQHPRRFSRTPTRTKREIRRRLLNLFPYAIVYEVRESECFCLAFAHLARKPGYWRDRLKP